ncbi:MAG: TM2 domain-containing protein [Bacteroidetes bacterium]|nr:TM2 domain-containing protein [Bacteroidota bacterium]MBL0014881.1 TM2 domain-containing protein [Bacteroidota bacterium]MBP6722024.1 TM2 domain-containing protein [Bacteroidia bacterium]
MNLEKNTCPACGAPTSNQGQLCPACDARQRDIFANPQNNQGRSGNGAPQGDQSKWIICLLLCWFLGAFGVHRFYTGHIGIGIAQLLTLGGCGIWTIIDFIILVTGNFKDSDGNPIKG